MLYREIMAVCSAIHTKHINTLRGVEGHCTRTPISVPSSRHSAVPNCPSDGHSAQLSQWSPQHPTVPVIAIAPNCPSDCESTQLSQWSPQRPMSVPTVPHDTETHIAFQVQFSHKSYNPRYNYVEGSNRARIVTSRDNFQNWKLFPIGWRQWSHKLYRRFGGACSKRLSVIRITPSAIK